MVDYLRLLTGGFVYSVAMPPVIAATVAKALELLHGEPERVARLQANGAHFVEYARKRGLDTGAGAGLSVTPVIVGDSIASVALSQELFERGVNALPVFYPAVPMKASRVRFFLTAAHTTQDIERAIDVVVDAKAALPKRLAVLKALATPGTGQAAPALDP
jgi:8-amino-7-oxononanoate synthase